MPECEVEDCRARALLETGYCLADADAQYRQRFLRSVRDGRLPLGDVLRGLTLGLVLFEELLPVLDGLDEDLDFSDAHFLQDVDFGPITFERRARFNGVRFDSDACFSRATFLRPARFNGATFGGDAIFGATRQYLHREWLGDRREGTDFRGPVEFVGARFVGAARFDWVHFGDVVTFANAQFDSELRHEERQSTIEDDTVAHQARRTISLEDTRFRAGVAADLPVGSVLAKGMDIGGASRLTVRGPVHLDQITLNHPLTIVTTNREEVRLLREVGSAPELRTLTGATLQSPLIVGQGISLERCEMSGAVGLNHLTLHAGTSPLPLHRRRRVLYDEIVWRLDDRRRGHRVAEAVRERLGRPTWAASRRTLDQSDPTPRRLDPGPIAGRYRQLRQGLEEAKNAPGSSAFYFGEMEMRRAASTSPYERFFLWLYWIVSGYGLRASRSILAYAAVVAAATAAFRYGPGSLHASCPRGQTCADLDDWWSTLVFLVRWSVSVFPAPETVGLSTGGQAVLLVLRFVSPILLALTFLAIRARVHR